LKRDQKFFDMYSLVIGVLAAICLGFFVLAMKMSDRTQGAFTSNAEEYLATVSARLEPFGQVNLPGDDLTPAGPQSAGTTAPTPVAATLTGPQVYNEACIACHGSGIGGAPMITDAAAWEARIAQGIDTLRQHAIEGYTGSAGYMPPKGGRLDLSDEEIYGAVDYMASEAEGN
jgi:cytochrome c5